MLLTIWNAIKMLWLGPVSFIRLARVRYLERKARKQANAVEVEQTVTRD